MGTDDWRDQDPGVSQDDIRELAEEARVQERIEGARLAERERAFAFATTVLDLLLAELISTVPTDSVATVDWLRKAFESGKRAFVPGYEPPEPAVFDLIAHLHAQRAWSLKTFGPGTAPTNAAFERYADAALSGPANDQDLDEIAGMLTVLLDGAMRAGHEPEAIAAALAEKFRINQSRRRPAPGSVPEGEAVEHEEGGE